MLVTEQLVEVSGTVFDDFEKALDAAFKELESDFDQATPVIQKSLKRALMHTAHILNNLHSSPWGGGVKSDNPYLQKRSGDGLREIMKSIKVGGNNLATIEGQISAGRMSIHETGGRITAKKSKYLTIPLPAAMDKRGVPLRKRARDWDKTFVRKSKKGNLLIFRKERNKIVPLYLLKKSVKIKPRLRLGKTLDGQMTVFQHRLADELEKML